MSDHSKTTACEVATPIHLTLRERTFLTWALAVLRNERGLAPEDWALNIDLQNRLQRDDEAEALRLYRLDKFGEIMKRGGTVPDHVRVAFAAEGANVHAHYAERVKEMRGE